MTLFQYFANNDFENEVRFEDKIFEDGFVGENIEAFRPITENYVLWVGEETTATFWVHARVLRDISFSGKEDHEKTELLLRRAPEMMTWSLEKLREIGLGFEDEGVMGCFDGKVTISWKTIVKDKDKLDAYLAD